MKSLRHIIALITAVLLLACQTVALAQTCVTALPGGNLAATASAPCHGDALDDASGRAVSSTCEASYALAENAKAPVFMLSHDPVLVIASRDTARTPSSVAAASGFVCGSPPLTVLHCRFLQ